MRMRIASLAAVTIALGAAMPAYAQQGGFGGVKGGGPRPTSGSDLGVNRAGTSSSGGFAYGDEPKAQGANTPAVKSATKPPCKVAPVSVNDVPHYKCGKNWYMEPRPGEGYAKVSPPPGY